MRILGLDAGNNEIKIVGEQGAFKLPSALGEYRDRKLQNTLSDSDVIFAWKGRKGFAGTLAETESEFGGSLVGLTKAHEDTLIRVLIGISKYAPDERMFSIVVGQPIARHTDDEKKQIKEMLQGVHKININGQDRVIVISRAEVSAEGGVAFWSNPRKGTTRIMDFGSGTVNGASLKDGKYVDRDSFTLGYGLNTIQSDDKDAFARSVYIETQKKRWSKNDVVLLVGGAAGLMIEHVQQFFPNAEVMRPKIDESKILHPVFANAAGMYKVAQEIYK